MDEYTSFLFLVQCCDYLSKIKKDETYIFHFFVLTASRRPVSTSYLYFIICWPPNAVEQERKRCKLWCNLMLGIIFYYLYFIYWPSIKDCIHPSFIPKYIGTGHKLLFFIILLYYGPVPWIWGCLLHSLSGQSKRLTLRVPDNMNEEEERRMQFLIQFSDKFICDRELVDQKLSRWSSCPLQIHMNGPHTKDYTEAIHWICVDEDRSQRPRLPFCLFLLQWPGPKDSHIVTAVAAGHEEEEKTRKSSTFHFTFQSQTSH